MDLYIARYVDRWVGLPLCLALRMIAPLLGRRLPPMGATTPPAAGARPRPRRVLGMKFYGLGNIVMILPVLRELRVAFPDVEIEFLTLPGNADLLRRSALVDRVHTLDVSSFPRFVRSVFVLMRTLRRRGFDAVLDFEQFMRVSGAFAFFTGAREAVGLDTDGQHRAWLYSTRISYTDSDHTVGIFLRLIAPFGVQPARLPEWRLPGITEDVARVEALLADAPAAGTGPLVVIHPGTGPNYQLFALKRWAAANFTALADALVERHGARIVFTGQGPDERALIDEVRGGMRHPSVETCDRLDVGMLTALLAQALFVVSNDTAAMHLAGAAGTPVAALLGPTSPRSYGPRGAEDVVFYKHLYCSPCLSNYNLKMSRCTNNVCMQQITVDEVLAAIESRFFGGPRTMAAGGE